MAAPARGDGIQMDGIYELPRDNLRELSIWVTPRNNCSPHFHSSIELTYVLEGSLKTIINGKSYQAEKDSLILFSSYSSHSNLQEGEGKSIVMILPLDMISAVFPRIFGKTFRQAIVTDRALCEEILRCMRMILKHSGQGLALDSSIVKGYAYVIIGLLVEKVGLEDLSNDKTDYLLRDILAYIQENYASPLTLDSLSHRFGYSKYSFSHLFNNYFGCSLTDYVNSLRARAAAAMLAQGGQSMTDVAMGAGFESLRTFYRVFKNHYGCTPSAYQKAAAK